MKLTATHKDEGTIGISLGAIADPFGKQLKAQGYEFDPEKMKRFESVKDAIFTLRFADIMPDSMADKCFAKLYKQIVTHVAGKNKLQIKKPLVK